jgi:hypothetical protein
VMHVDAVGLGLCRCLGADAGRSERADPQRREAAGHELRRPTIAVEAQQAQPLKNLCRAWFIRVLPLLVSR